MTERDRLSTALFTPIQTGRASTEVVRQVRSAIEGGELRPGDRLPPERELAERLGLSRVTVRDALRALEATGLVAIRVGAHGGAFVSVPRPEHLQQGLENLLMMSALTHEQVTETRLLFELGAIDLICERATTEDIADLEEICDRSEAALAADRFDVSLSAEFHARLAHCTHNPAVGLITEAFQQPILASLQSAKVIAPHMGDPGVVEHREIVSAIASGDIERARSVMGDHLRRTLRRVRSSDRPSECP
jgi:GntR family transcriptional regulator, transcriptional repressor for pyruvate dehydrogenase complex